MKNNTFQKAFAKAKKEHRPAFMPFMVAGDWNESMSISIARLLAKYGDMLEIGIPYSDPLADGPVIQTADERARKAGMNTDKAFRLIKRIRKESDIPVTILVYANLVYQRGVQKFYQDAKRAGVSGVLIPDVPIEECRPFVEAAKKQNIAPIFLVAQTSSDQRVKEIGKYAQGYLYLVSVLGVTGARKTISKQTIDFVRRVRKETKLSLALGFGISTKKQIEQAFDAGADGVIVGSALVSIVEKSRNNPSILEFRIKKYLKEIGFSALA